MAGDNPTAERYRNRAKELRLIAANAVDPETRRILNEVAEYYDATAKELAGSKLDRRQGMSYSDFSKTP
jgi:predicted kinase